MNSKKGFYAIFVVCMVLVFGYGLMLTMKNLQALREAKKEAPAQTSNNNTYVNTDTFTEKTGSSQTASKNEEVAIQSDSKQNTTKKSDEKSSAETTNRNTAAAQGTSSDEAERDDGPKVAVFNPVEKMVLPVSGKVLVGFGDQYSQVTGEWVYNDGVELSSKSNEKVKAVLSGKVIDVGSNENDGIFIVLDHGNGLKTKYSNLATNKLIKVGQSVKKGEVISKAAQTYALGSFTDQPHIHFSVQQDGDYIDPLAKLPK